MKIEKLKELFWDYKWKSVLEKIDSPYVIARVLEMGNSKQVKIFINGLGRDKILDFLANYGERLLSKVSYNFWKLYYEKNINKKA